MKRLQGKALTKEECTKQFKVKQNDVQKTESRPTYTLIKPIWDAIKTKIINLVDPRDTIWEKLRLICNTSISVNRPVTPVVASTNQGQPIPWVRPIKQCQR